jgi:hypothetical protein
MVRSRDFFRSRRSRIDAIGASDAAPRVASPARRIRRDLGVRFSRKEN